MEKSCCLGILCNDAAADDVRLSSEKNMVGVGAVIGVGGRTAGRQGRSPM
jgi:hypothetical protein